MSQQTLRTVIAISGNVDNSFGKIGGELTILGSQIDQISQKLISLGKESIGEYAEYDDLMREVKAVGEFTDSEVKMLDGLNREIAKTTIFSNKEAAQAEVFMGQLGLSTREIATLLPDVLSLAQAGNLDLADSVMYLYSTLRSLDMGLDQAGVLTDQMAKTAAIGATDVDTLGDAMTRMGSSMNLFKGGAPEILTILSAMSDFGEDMRGSEGGTALRNFALALVAPAGSGRQTLAALENLGMTHEELAAYMEEEDINATSAAAAIKTLGLEIYDADGNMRNMLDIISDMRTALNSLEDDSLRAKVLREIFGKRGFVTAENLFGISDADYMLEYEQIIDSKGFADSMADTMQGGIGGALRSLEASKSLLMTTIGEALAPTVQNVAGWLEGIADGLSEMDEGKLNALVTGAGALAAAGPGLLLVGGAFRVLGMLATPAGAIGLTVVAVAALAGYLHQVSEANFRDHFGKMELDLNELNDYVSGLTTTFQSQQDALSEWTGFIDSAAESYSNLTSAFSQDLLTNVLTGKELKQEDKDSLNAYVDEIVSTVQDAIVVKRGEQLGLLDIFLGDRQTPDEMAAFSTLIDWESSYYQGLMNDAYAVGEEMRQKLTEALQDDTLDESERMAIRATVDRMNAIMAEIAAFNDQAAFETAMLKAQSVSYDSFSEYMSDIKADLKADLDAYDERALEVKGIAIASYKQQYAEAETDADRAEVDRRHENNMQGLEGSIEEGRRAIIDLKSMLAETAFESLVDDNLQGAWSFLNQLTTDGLPSDGSGYYDFSAIDFDKYVAEGAREGMAQALLTLGDSRMLDMLNPFAGTPGVDELLFKLNLATGTGLALQEQNQRKAEEDYWTSIYNYNPYELVPDIDLANAEASIAALSDTPVTLTPDADIAPAEEDIAALNDTPVSAIVNGNTTSLYESIMAFDGMSISVNVSGNSSGSRSGGGKSSGSKSSGTAGSLFNPAIKKYAEGGRAVEESIFGDAGPEWAIPEAHSQRTAWLLDSAREASGFTWPELVERAGGLSAGPDRAPTQLIYSPTIIANDARGVEQKLIEDKARLDKWWEEKQLLESRVAYD